ncbi:unnamed protein product [Acanthoscelides obtectus]|uniref:PHD-type domain-containing protein n=1 Tax=Acanthoscelides obtectus TaxID=200917 RepID=A0A9P0NU61_ACAOB|nr:unnamed protein product [Acanthoscelides obtectus]CAK1639662.1 hypothetical protein AOBTE_LOCUS11299 [Acanthoscelides obtectus]
MTKGKFKTRECGKCSNNITKTQYSLKCAGTCGGWYHRTCTGLSDEQFLAYEKRKTDQKWLCGRCGRNRHSSSSDQSDASDPVPMDNPSNKDIMKTIQQKFSEIEKALNFNGEVMEGLQRTIQAISDENRELRKTQEHLKNRVAELEKEVVTLKEKVSKDEDEARKKRVIITGIKGNPKIDENAKKSF